MKKLFLIFLLLVSLSIPADSRMTSVMCGSGSPAGCAASYGGELAVSANATDDLGGNEADDTAGWTNSNSNTFESIDTGTPYTGTYHLIATSVDSADGFYRSLSGLSGSTVYRLSFYYKHDQTASATWSCGMGGAVGQRNYGVAIIQPTQADYTEYEIFTLYNANQDTFNCTENNTLNNGSIYIDNYTLTLATPCYAVELYTHSNAANLAGEVDATTGWTEMNSGTMASIETESPHDGSSHLAVTATGVATGGAYADIGTDFSLQVGHKYFIRFWAKGDATNAFFYALDGVATTATYGGGVLTISTATYTEYGFSFVYAAASHRYLKIFEANGANTGTAYIDGISIKEIIAE